MSCKKCKCKVCSCIKNDVPKIAVNGIVQNQNENDVVNIKVPTKTSQLINDSGFGQGNGGGTGGQKIEDIRVNGELVPIINKEAIMNVPTKTSNLINDSNFVTKPYVDTHIVNKANPHNVTKEQIGLGNVDNTSDLNKPISTATQTELNKKINKPTTNNTPEYVLLADGSTAPKSDFGKVKSVNGKEGDVILKTSDLENDSDYTTKSYVDEGVGRVIDINTSGILGSINPSTNTSSLEDGVYRAQIPGTYTNASNIVVKEGYYTLLRKDNGVWKLESEVEMPTITPTGVVEEGNTEAVSGGEVYESTIQKDSTKILDSDKDFVKIERPDLQRFIIVDSNDVVLHETADLKEVQDLEKRTLPDNAECVNDNFDRPDLQGLIILDKDDRVLETKNTKNKEENQIINRYHIIEDNNSFGIADTIFIPQNLYQAYDDLMSLYPNYISKRSIGKTSVGNMDIWVYTFKPKKPSKKILLISGSHASEKVYQKINLDLATNICNNWRNNDLLTYLRSECEIDFIPINCPANALGLNGSITGGRRSAETDPIDVTWTKVNGIVTITYNVANFPTSNPNVNGATYFSEQGKYLVNRLCVTIFDSSNTVLLPNNGYGLKSVVNGNTITINSPETGTNGNGTAKMVIYTDIARNMNVYDLWKVQPTSKNLSQYPSDHGDSYHDNIGTKPASLNEAKVLGDLMDTENYDYIIDCHSGAGTNYVDPLCPLGYNKMQEVINHLTNIVTASSNFTLNCTIGEVHYYRFITSPRCASYTYFFETQNKPSAAIEWSHPGFMDAENSNGAYNLLTNTINFFNNLNK